MRVFLSFGRASFGLCICHEIVDWDGVHIYLLEFGWGKRRFKRCLFHSRLQRERGVRWWNGTRGG